MCDFVEYVNSIISCKLIGCLGVAKHFCNSCTKVIQKCSDPYARGQQIPIITSLSLLHTGIFVAIGLKKQNCALFGNPAAVLS